MSRTIKQILEVTDVLLTHCHLEQFLPLLSFFLLSAPLVCATCEILKREMSSGFIMAYLFT